MQETMDDYKDELEASFRKLADKDVMSGKVENEDEATDNLAWEHMKELKESKETFDVKVGGMVNGGLIAYVEELRGFIPASQIAMEFVDNMDEYLGKTLNVMVITADRERKKLILSAKAVLKEAEERKKNDRMASYKEGDVVIGTIETIMPYGAFIAIGDGISGLVHISQICERRIKSPAEVLKTGDEVRARIIAIKDGKISLSIKVLEDMSEEDESEHEHIDLPEAEDVTTCLGDIFKNIRL